MELHERLTKARRGAGFETAADAAKALGVKYPTYAGHENGASGFRAETGELYARRFKVRFEWLMRGIGAMTDDALVEPPADDSPLPPPNARIGARLDLDPTGERIPLFGQAIGGQDGRFILNGAKIADLIAPPVLWGVRDAYAVYIAGDSMEPRYFAGETAFVNPYMPVRRGDFVVVQIASREGDPPFGYIKQFITMSDDKLRLKQFNPEKDLTFLRRLVVSVHKIVQAG